MISFPLFIGHRGACGFAPENTLISFEIAKKCGASMIEFDVKFTKDRKLIIMHDSKVDRTTNGTGRVLDYTLAEIKKLDAGSWFDASFAGTKIPTLKETFDTLKKFNLAANIEIKPCPGTDVELTQLVIPFIQEHWPKSLPSPLISSFSTTALQIARELDDKLNLGLILENPPPHDWKQWAKKLNISAISVSHWSLKDDTLIKEMHALNYPVLAYTVNELERAQELYDMGVDSIFTNYPGSIISR